MKSSAEIGAEVAEGSRKMEPDPKIFLKPILN